MQVAFAVVLKGHIPTERGGSDQGAGRQRGGGTPAGFRKMDVRAVGTTAQRGVRPEGRGVLSFCQCQ